MQNEARERKRWGSSSNRGRRQKGSSGQGLAGLWVSAPPFLLFPPGPPPPPPAHPSALLDKWRQRHRSGAQASLSCIHLRAVRLPLAFSCRPQAIDSPSSRARYSRHGVAAAIAIDRLCQAKGKLRRLQQ